MSVTSDSYPREKKPKGDVNLVTGITRALETGLQFEVRAGEEVQRRYVVSVGRTSVVCQCIGCQGAF